MYGYSINVGGKALKVDVTRKKDIMTDTVLGLLLNNQLDENNE